MKLFGVIGVWELVIILVIVCLIFGPALFKKLGKQMKKTGNAAKSAVENGAHAAGKDVDFDSMDKSKILDKVESFQDRVDKMFDDDDADSEEPEKTEAKKDDASA